VAELARQGRRVRAVSRRAAEPWPNGVEAVTANILRSDEVRTACRDAAVVYDAANVPYSQWQQILPAMTESVIAGASAADAVLVMVDNLYMYGLSSNPMTEDSPCWLGVLRLRRQGYASPNFCADRRTDS
jgi:nucleoside-diphosphate-sugar epimerase